MVYTLELEMRHFLSNVSRLEICEFVLVKCYILVGELLGPTAYPERKTKGLAILNVEG